MTKRSLWLMYHDVYIQRPGPEIPGSAAIYHVSIETFDSHLRAIGHSGLNVITVGEFVSGQCKSGESLVLTFDDGWSGAFQSAVPSLLDRGWKGTFYVTRDFVGRRNFCRPGMLREAAALGMEIGIHGTTHRMLSSCSYQEIVEEFRACKGYLESMLGQSVDHASIPGGDLSPNVVSGAAEAGVKSLSNSRPGVNFPTTPRFDLSRLAMREAASEEDMQRFCRFDLGRERARWALLEMPRRVLGMKRYAKLRRTLLRERAEVFRP